MSHPYQETHPVRSSVFQTWARANFSHAATTIAVWVAIVLAASGCSDSPTAAERRITSLELQPRNIVVDDTEPIQLDAIVRDQLGHRMAADPNGMRLRWYSTDPDIATVDENGIVAPVSSGSASIIAEVTEGRGTSGTEAGDAMIPVSSSASAVTVTGVAGAIQHVSGNGQTGAPGAKLASDIVVRAITKKGATMPGVVVDFIADIGGNSFSPSSVTTDANGIARSAWTLGQTSGLQTGSVRARKGNASLAVNAIASATCLSVAPPTATLTSFGSTLQLTATTSIGGTVSWVSSNNAVATVSSTGLVTAVSNGGATITATLASCPSANATITVAQAVASVTTSPPSASIQTSQTAQLSAIAKDANGNTIEGVSFSWASSNAAVATVNASGLVTGASAGSANITASAGGKTGSSTVTVTVAPPPPGGDVTVATVTVSPPSRSVEVNQTVQVDAIAKDAGAAIVTGASFTWVSSNPAVATVDANGLVTGKAIGSTTVTASSGGKSGSSAITVTLASPIGGGGNPADFNIIKQGIRPRGYGVGTYSLKSPAPGRIAYYVATNGNDVNPGTMSAPFRNINKAAQVAVAGDVVIIRDGTYQESVLVKGNGTASAPIVFQAQNRGGVIMSGGQHVFRPSLFYGISGVTQHKYVTVKGLIFRQYAGLGTTAVALHASYGWTVEDCLFDNAGETGVGVSDHNVTIQRTTFQYNYVHAFVVYGGRSGGSSPSDPDYQPVENLRIIDVVMRGNHTRNLYGAAVSSTRVVKIGVTRGMLIDNLESYENYGSGLWLDSKNSVYTIRNSYIHHNRGVMGPDGISARSAGRGLYLEKNWGTGLVENNVIADNEGGGTVIVSSNDVAFKNNLLLRNEQCIIFVAATGAGYEGFLLRNVSYRNTYMKGWRETACIWGLGGDFSPGLATMGITVDQSVYDNTGNSVPLVSFPFPYFGANTLAQMQTTFGWEFSGAFGTISH